MRRLGVLVTVAALLVAGSALPAGSQEPQVWTSAGNFAMAQWKVTEGGERTIYFAAGFSRASATEWPFFGYVGRAECTRVDRGHHSHFVCRGRAKPVQLAPGDFVVDPALQTARLSVVEGEWAHEITWQATAHEPRPFFHQHLGTDVGAQAWSSVTRRAVATGVAFGEQLEASRRGLLSQSAMVDVYLRNRGGLPHIRFADDGTLIFRQRLAQ